jgi:hypothetical protein
MFTFLLLLSTRRSNILGWLTIVGLTSRTKYQLPLLWVFFNILFLFLDNVVELPLQIFKPFLVRVWKWLGGEFFYFIFEVWGTTLKPSGAAGGRQTYRLCPFSLGRSPGPFASLPCSTADNDAAVSCISTMPQKETTDLLEFLLPLSFSW